MASSYHEDGVGQGQGQTNDPTTTTTIHTTTTQTATLTNSLLNTPFHHKTTSSSSPSSSASSSTPQPPAKPNTKPKPPPSKSRPAKSHPCPWPNCGRYFTCPHNVRQHIREMHTFERPSVCPICRAQGADGSFTRPFGLNRHLEQVHGVTKADRRKRARAQNRAAGGDATAATTREGGRNRGSEAYGVEVGELAGKMTEDGVGGGEFAQTAALLAEANAQMGSPNEDNAEMPDDSFQPGTDASDSVSSEEASTTVAASTSGGFSCSACGSIFAQPHAIYEHMHTAHANPHSRLCSCNACKTLFFPREEDAVEHAWQLQGGGFLVLGDGVLAAAAAAGVANSAAMSPFSHHSDNAGMDPAALGFAEGAIDPGLLLLHSSSLSHAADAEGGGGALLPDLGRM